MAYTENVTGSTALCPRTPDQLLELAAALKRENPARTAAQVAVVLATHAGWAPGERTLQRHFARLGLGTRPQGTPARAFGRFEAQSPNELWTGDALHGPAVAGRKTYLFAFIDDYSRAIVGHRWGHSEDTVRREAALRAALACRGVPTGIYVDNGSAFVDTQLLRACAVLGIRLIHSRPAQPAGRGKIERFFRTVREQFLVELDTPGRTPVTDLTELNRLFTAWLATVYHRRVHSETGCRPLERFLTAGPPALPTPVLLHEAFLWSERRTVTKTATVSLHGNLYEVDAALVGHRVELVFDPFDLTDIDVRYDGRAMGKAIPHRIGRHVHRKARPETPPPPPAATGIDYLRLVEAAHTAEAAQALQVRYAELTEPPTPSTGTRLEQELASFAALGAQPTSGDPPLPGQFDLLDLIAELDQPDTNTDTAGGPS